MAKAVADRQLAEILGYADPPQVPAEVLRRDAILLLGGNAFGQLNQGIVYGLGLLLEKAGDLVGGAGGEFLKANKEAIARIVTSIYSGVILAYARQPYVRLFAFGSLYDNIDAGIEAIKKAVAEAVKKK